MSELKLGKVGVVNTEQIKGGIKKEQIKDKNLENIFDTIDVNKDGVIDADEMKKFQEDIANTAGNDKLSNKEAGKYLKQNNIKDVDKKDLLKFIDVLSQSSENIESSTVTEANGQKFVHIKYKDGTTETINPDRSTEIASQGENGETIVKHYDKDKKLTSQKTVDTDGNTEVTNYDGSGKPTKTETTAKGGNPVVTVNYEDGEPAASTVKDGTTLSEYVYDEAGEPVLTKKTENKGIPAKEKTTEFTYNEDGTTTAVITEADKVTTQTIKDDAVISETVKQGNKTTQTTLTENGREEVITEGNTVTKNTYNADNKKLSQEQTIDGQTYTVEYDGNGNTKGVVVQNGESPAAIAKKFGCSLEDLLNANPEAVKGKAPNQYFVVGADIKIPGEMDAAKFAKLNEGRQTKEQAIAGYQAYADEVKQVEEEAAARKPITFTNKDYNTYEEMAKALFKREGNENPSKLQMKQRIEDLQKTNPDIKDGELKGKKVTANVAQEMHDRVAGREQSIKEFKENVETRKQGEAIANKFYQIKEDNRGLNSMKKMQELLDNEVTADNIIAVLDAYDKDSVNHGDSSIIYTVTSEIGAGGTPQQKKVLTTIMDKLCEAAKKAGVSDEDIQHAKSEFETSMNKEMNATMRRTNPKDMEKAVDFLRGAIVARKTGGAEDMSDADAIAQFNSDFAATDADAQKMYADAREEEGWTAKVGDTVCGWFGCTTIDDMDAKLGKNASDVKRLAAAAGDEAEFKKIYKEVFGVEFDKNKIAARDNALANYQQAQNLSSTINITSGILKKAGSLDYAGLRNEVKEKFQYDDSTLDSIIQGYADNLGVKISTDAEKQEMLTRFLQETQENAAAGYRDTTKGKTIEQLGKDLDLLTKSAFGTNDIVKDVIQFNENQQTTEMVTEAAFEIAGTVALQFVPGLGQAAAARLALSAAKWGTKAVKVANYAAKAEKAFNTAKNIQKGTQFTSKVASKAAQVATKMANAGVATMGVDLSNGKSVKEATQKTLMNMSFAGVGAGSSMLAPKLMQTFGMSNALATEVAEEIINAAGTYGITKLEGGEYGKQDAFIDFAAGLIMSRISHVKSPSVKGAADGVDLTPPAPAPAPHGVKAAPGETYVSSHEIKLDAPPKDVLDVKPEGSTISWSEANKPVKPEAPVPKENVLDHATVDGASTPGGKLGEAKFETAKQQVKEELPAATPKRTAQIHDEADKLQVQSRQQGREIKHIISDEVKYVEIGKERIDIATADAETLARARKAVSGYADGTRNKEGLLKAIDERIEQLSQNNAASVKTVSKHPEIDTAAFDEMFDKSGFKRTSSDQQGITVDKLGAGKFAKYQEELKALCDAAQTDAQLDMLANRVKSFRSDPQRKAFMDIIEERRTQIKSQPAVEVVHEAPSAPVETPKPAKSTEVVSEINKNVAQTSDGILAGKKGALSPHDAATLEDYLVNQLKTTEDIENFMTQLKERVGVDEKGVMHKYEVQGKDHAADIMQKAETKLKNIKAHQADFEATTGKIDDAIANNKGLSGDDLNTIRAFSQKSNSVEELQQLVDKMSSSKAIKSFGGSKKLIAEMRDKIDLLKAKAAANTSAPKAHGSADLAGGGNG